jgi:V8-like Glu-specific endopeptidase
MRRRQTALVTSGLLVAGALAWTGSASAAPSQKGVDRSSHDRIVKYWTAERRASATPREMVRPAKQLKGKPGGGGGGGGTVTGATWTGGGNVVKTTGKVYFSMGGSNYVCSGSAIAGTVNLVLSAGHCVWDDADGFATNWMFWPGYDNGLKPYGTWTATSLFTTSGWHATSDRDFPNDAGIAVVSDGSGGKLSTALGTLPSMGTSTSVTGTTFSAFGYPAAKKYHGEILSYCQGPGELGYYDGDNTVSIACDMTGGSSGGAWFDQAGGTGKITSLNSYGYGGLTRMFGPTFDSQEGTAYAAANDGTCGSNEVCVVR